MKLAPACLLLSLVAAPLTANDRFTTVDLRPTFDNDGISWVTNLEDGNFTFNCSYPADQMPKPGRRMLAGVPFEFPDYSDGLNNCARLQRKVIDVPDVGARTIYFLGSSLFGGHPAVTATLYYTGGGFDTHVVVLDAWEQLNNLKVLETSVFHVQNRIADGGGWPLYIAAIHPRRDDRIDAIVFGDTYTTAQVFAITLSDQAPCGQLAETLPPFGVSKIDWGLEQVGPHRVHAALSAMRGPSRRVQVDWTCGDQKASQAVDVAPDDTTSVSFACTLPGGGSTMTTSPPMGCTFTGFQLMAPSRKCSSDGTGSLPHSTHRRWASKDMTRKSG